MFGTSHCCYSSSCLSDTHEPTPAWVGAERQTVYSILLSVPFAVLRT